jgi:hypothetical protein
MPKEQTPPAQSRSQRKKLSAKESVKRMRAFAKRKDQLVAAVRTGKNRSVPA